MKPFARAHKHGSLVPYPVQGSLVPYPVRGTVLPGAAHGPPSARYTEEYLHERTPRENPEQQSWSFQAPGVRFGLSGSGCGSVLHRTPRGFHCIWKTISAVFQGPCCCVATFWSFDERRHYKMELATADLSESGTTPRPRPVLRSATERTSRSRRARLPKRGLARDRTARPVARLKAMKAATRHSEKLACAGAGSDRLGGVCFEPAEGNAVGDPMRVQTPHEGTRPCVPGPGGPR